MKYLKYLILLLLLAPFGCTWDLDFIEAPNAARPVASFRITKTPPLVAPVDPGFVNQSQNADRYEWNFGDGEGSEEVNPAHTYDEPGEYPVTLTAFRENELDDTTVTVVIVGSVIADFSVENENCPAPCEITFRNSSQGADQYEWDFGDGSPVSSEQEPVHTYDLPGTYQVKLTATGPGGSTNITKPVQIEYTTFQQSISFSVKAAAISGVGKYGHVGSFPGWINETGMTLLDIRGAEENTKTYPLPGNSAGQAIIGTNSGLAFTGCMFCVSSTGNERTFLILTDNDGNQTDAWLQDENSTLPVGSNAFTLYQLQSGGFLVGGSIFPQGGFIYAPPLDGSADPIDVRPTRKVIDLFEAGDGAIYALGSGTPGYVIKLNPDFSIAFEKTIDTGGATRLTQGKAMVEGQNELVITGFEGEDLAERIWLGKVTLEGSRKRDIYLESGTERGVGNHMARTADGGFAIAAELGQGDALRAVLIKTDAEGQEEWRKTFKPDNNTCTRGLYVEQAADGGYFFVAGGCASYAFKTDAQGNVN